MPAYDYECVETGEIVSAYIPLNAPDIDRQQQIIDGKVYKRVYAAPLSAVNPATRLGAATEDDFRRVTTDKRGLKVGDMWEISAEMSEKREKVHGKDPVKEQFYAKFEKEAGTRHPDLVRREKVEKANERLKEWGIKINL